MGTCLCCSCECMPVRFKDLSFSTFFYCIFFLLKTIFGVRCVYPESGFHLVMFLWSESKCPQTYTQYVQTIFRLTHPQNEV